MHTLRGQSQLDSCRVMPLLRTKKIQLRLKRVSVIIDKDKNIKMEKKITHIFVYFNKKRIILQTMTNTLPALDSIGFPLCVIV